MRVSSNPPVSRLAVLLFAAVLPAYCLGEQAAPPHAGFHSLDALLDQAVARGEVPGAVVVVGHQGKTVYRKAFGFRSLQPARKPMTPDTIFDLASLTKPLATATSVMLLVERGQVRLDEAAAHYLPEFARDGKDAIPVRQLLTHFSGLRPDLDLDQSWQGREEAWRRVCDEKPSQAPGSKFVYSDINYLVLGELVARVSGLPLERFAEENIFQPLGMKETRFLPPEEWRSRIAPTEFDESGRMLRGVVHDPTARRMGGVAGHAGLFGTADDVARYAQALLDGGRSVLSPQSVALMTSRQQPPGAGVQRGLGWDIDSPYSSPRGTLFPVGSFGHTGFTGTSLWIDPASRTYIVLLTNAVHPRGGKSAKALRASVADAVAIALGVGKLAAETAQPFTVKAGIDVLQDRTFAPLRASAKGASRRVGLLTNQNGVTARGERTIDVLARAPGVQLAAIFSPEHGIRGTLDTASIAHSRDQATGVPVYSVYGDTDAERRPPLAVLQTLDAVVIDLQSVGVRFYTYETLTGYFLEAAAQAGIDVLVLDRPNPITGTMVQGPVSDRGRESYVNYHSLPVRHGMTLGELAQLFNGERKIGARLSVLPMENWRRGLWYDQTGLAWINPSPNLRNLTEAALYPGLGFLDWSNISVGRGTETPFELVGAPWIDARQLAAYLSQRKITGVGFEPATFTPTERAFAGKLCQGVRLVVTDRDRLDAPLLGIEIAAALQQLYPNDFRLERMGDLLVHRETMEALRAGEDPRRIAAQWNKGLAAFATTRERYLIYK